MNIIARLIPLILLEICLFSQSPAHSAAVKATFYACKDQAVFRQAFQRPAGKGAKDSKASSDVYFKTKIAAGECLQLARGQEISVDQRAGDLWCVRLSGGLDCYWTADKAIDINPSMSSNAGNQTQHKKNR